IVSSSFSTLLFCSLTPHRERGTNPTPSCVVKKLLLFSIVKVGENGVNYQEPGLDILPILLWDGAALAAPFLSKGGAIKKPNLGEVGLLCELIKILIIYPDQSLPMQTFF